MSYLPGIPCKFVGSDSNQTTHIICIQCQKLTPKEDWKTLPGSDSIYCGECATGELQKMEEILGPFWQQRRPPYSRGHCTHPDCRFTPRDVMSHQMAYHEEGEGRLLHWSCGIACAAAGPADGAAAGAAGGAAGAGTATSSTSDLQTQLDALFLQQQAAATTERCSFCGKLGCGSCGVLWR